MEANTPRRHEAVLVEEQGPGFHTVLVGHAGRVLITNDVGRRVLELCDGNRTPAEIVEAIVARHQDVPPERVATEVAEFLAAARDKEAIAWTS